MNLTGIDHVEFYTGDAKQASFYLCSAFGFELCGQAGPETGLAGRVSLLHRQGRIRLVLTSPLTGEPDEVSSYLMRHGDGAAVIAFGTDDARRAFRGAVSRGATAVREPAEFAAGGARAIVAEVSGFGDVVHRFVERHGGPDAFLPGVMDMCPPAPRRGEFLLEAIDHVAVCLPPGELDTTVKHYQEAFGFNQIFEEYIQIGSQAMNSKVVQAPSERITFTLIEPDTSRQPGQIDEFLARHSGAGVQHLAFLCHHIAETVEKLQSRGVSFLRTPGSYYDQLESRTGIPGDAVSKLRRVNVLADRDHWGEMFQIFTQSMHARRTYFVEIIERQGARTFGSGNIKALYEAVERERCRTANTGS